ncbi:MAG: hypothetical protein Ct9H90mP7_0080 [Candidatus Neomarinimicrobiota bacterium]|nr:MAG: hypothetical protein Ct9H90mP7_0080 [Candidatus Neomarinimicrobiota bacterium]
MRIGIIGTVRDVGLDSARLSVWEKTGDYPSYTKILILFYRKPKKTRMGFLLKLIITIWECQPQVF